MSLSKFLKILQTFSVIIRSALESWPQVGSRGSHSAVLASIRDADHVAALYSFMWKVYRIVNRVLLRNLFDRSVFLIKVCHLY